MKKTIFIVLFACNAYAGVTTRLIKTEEELQQGIEGANQMLDQMFKESPLQVKGQAEYSKQHREGQLALLWAMKNRQDAFIDLNGKKIGFIATHLDPNQPDQVIIDKADMGMTPENRQTVGGAILAFIVQQYPNATKVWTATPKKNAAGDELPAPHGFEKSDYMDGVHDAQFCQGWEKDLTK